MTWSLDCHNQDSTAKSCSSADKSEEICRGLGESYGGSFGVG